MNWENLTKTQRVLIVLIFPLILLVAFVFLYLLPTIQTIDKLVAEEKKLAEEINKANAVAAKYEDLKRLNEELQRKMEFLKTFLPTETEVSYVLKRLSEIGLQKGLIVTQWKPQAKVVHPSNEIYEIPVEVGMRGKYHIFGSFFADITKIDRIVNIKKMEMKQGERDPVTLVSSITAVTYSLIPEEEKAKAEKRRK
ncbi:MAG: type 4a pilus biogenesis protein PilO [Thermodesulfovibrio sp.]|nr:type 4a pilus biogenesis protein PilO [Thermodesulfovibrio sp.]